MAASAWTKTKLRVLKLHASLSLPTHGHNLPSCVSLEDPELTPLRHCLQRDAHAQELCCHPTLSWSDRMGKIEAFPDTYWLKSGEYVWECV